MSIYWHTYLISAYWTPDNNLSCCRFLFHGWFVRYLLLVWLFCSLIYLLVFLAEPGYPSSFCINFSDLLDDFEGSTLHMFHSHLFQFIFSDLMLRYCCEIMIFSFWWVNIMWFGYVLQDLIKENWLLLSHDIDFFHLLSIIRKVRQWIYSHVKDQIFYFIIVLLFCF